MSMITTIFRSAMINYSPDRQLRMPRRVIDTQDNPVLASQRIGQGTLRWLPRLGRQSPNALCRIGRC